MRATKILLAVFTGTGNTLLAANALADELRRAGKTVEMIPMDRPEPLTAANFDENTALGLAVPVAAFSTYPTVWRFIDALPEGKGREAFLLATMGGTGLGMQAPLGRALRKKGYAPVGARCIRMCGNYGSGIPKPEVFVAVHMRAEAEAKTFCERLIAGRARWRRGWLNPLAAVFAWTARTGKSFRTFRRAFPLAVDGEKCTGCGLCARLCPEKAMGMAMRDGKAVLDGDACQSCQRCVSYCPAKAVGTPGKETRQHRPVSAEAFTKFLESPSQP